MSPLLQERIFPAEAQALLIDTIDKKSVLLDFDGGQISSDAGMLLVAQVDKQLGLSEALISAFRDERDPDRISHSAQDLLRQHVYQIAAGYEDQDDSDALRTDPVFKMLLGQAPETGSNLASQPTMSRFENSVSRSMLWRMGEVFLERFMASYAQAPEVIVLDFDDTADRVHGEQEQALYNSHVGDHCFMPLHVYEGLSGRFITALLKPKVLAQMLPIVRRLIVRLRTQWPHCEIIFRGDSHFTYPEVMDYLEPHVHYVTGLGTNSVLKAKAREVEQEAEGHYGRGDRTKVLRFHSFPYQARSWPHARRVIVKVEVTEKGTNTRFVVTDLKRIGAKRLYQKIYCARGQMENYIKDHKLGLKSDRTSCHRFLANQFRLFLHSAAYVLLHALRTELIGHSNWSRARFETLRGSLLKLGATVKEHADSIRVSLSSHIPVEQTLRSSFALLALLAPT
ncbi:MAG: IS1380 family transposase [Rhodothermales bacterium]